MTHENKPPKSKKPNYKQQPRKFQDKPVLTTSSTLHKECRFCGYKHENKKEKCPAWGKTCNPCKGRNHFKSKCKKVNVNSDSALDDSDDDCWLNAIDAVSEKSISVVEANVDKKVTALMNVNDCEVHFQLDSAADVNTICKNFVGKNQVRPTSITLVEQDTDETVGRSKSYREEFEYRRRKNSSTDRRAEWARESARF